MQNLIVACADVGSVAKGNFGWWSSDGGSGTRPSSLALRLASILSAGVPVALGFECPLFVPLTEDENLLTGARPGEGSRAWSAGAGCGALATGIVQSTWLLQEIRRKTTASTEAFLSWPLFSSSGSGLFLWEAFVTDSAKGGSHHDDARIGVETFMRALPDPTQVNAVVCATDVQSLIGAALLRTGWVSDPAILLEACLVVKAVHDAV